MEKIVLKARNRRRRRAGAALPLPLLLASTAAVWAEPATTESGVVEDVVVNSSFASSQKQATALQNKPVAATIVTPDQLENLQITNLEDAKKLVPSLSYKYGNLMNNTYNIRGIGNANNTFVFGVFSGVNIYVDGVYLPLPGSWTLDIPDLAGVTVLKGPQATRGGFDNTSGAIHIATELPSFSPATKLEASTGSYDFVQVKASTTGPVFDSDWAAFRIAVFGRDRQGYIYSINNPSYKFNDFRDIGGRAQLLLQPSDDLSVRLSVDYSHNETHVARLTNGAVLAYANGAPFAGNVFQRAAKLNYLPHIYGFASYTNDVGINYPQEAVESYGASAHIKYNLGDVAISSLTAFRQYDFHYHGYSNAIINVDTQRQSAWHPSARSVQQDLSVAATIGDLADVNGGLFYYWQVFRTWNSTPWRGDQAGIWFANPSTPAATAIAQAALDGAGLSSYDNPETHSIAPYANAVWHVSPDVDVTTGLRFSYTARNALSWGQTYGRSFGGLSPADAAAAAALRASNLGAPPYYNYFASTHHGLFSGLASVSYKFAPDASVYVTYSHGVRPGGPNVGSTALPNGASTTIKPEELDNYEIGVKSEWFDGRLLANAAAFWMIDRNYITSLASITGGTAITYMANAKRVTSRGFEADVRAQPIEGLNVYGSGVFNDAFYSSFESAPCPIELSNVYKTCDFTGQRVAIVPRWAFSVGAQYSRPLDFEAPFFEQPVIGFVGSDFQWQSSYYSDANNSIYSVIPSYGLLNFNLGVKTADDSLKITGWAHNALDKRYYLNVSAVSAVAAGLIAGTVGNPLMAGVTVATKW
jgi:iron complex outermembrane receptor protein